MATKTSDGRNHNAYDLTIHFGVIWSDGGYVNEFEAQEFIIKNIDKVIEEKLVINGNECHLTVYSSKITNA